MIHICIDIDGTLAHWGHRLSKAGKEPSRQDKKVYTKWLRTIQNRRTLIKDLPISGMVGFTLTLSESKYATVVYLTARNEKYREITEKWLEICGFPKLPLIMRPNKNYTSTGNFKKQVIKEVAAYRPVIIIDDDPRDELKEVCKEEGWTLLKAMSGGSFD